MSTSKIDTRYKRTLTLKDLIYLGLSLTIGAGIFVLMNDISKYSKQLTWFSVLLAGIISLLTALSYAELSSIFKNNKAEYGYIESVTNDKVANICGLIILISDVFILATVALGLSYYISKVINFNPIIIAISMVLFINYLNYLGIELSKNVSRVFMYIKMFILVVIILAGFLYSSQQQQHENIFLTKDVNQHNIFVGSIIALFAYLGFNNLINFSEESINPGTDIAEALIYTVSIVLVLYTLLAVASIKVLGSSNLSKTNVPLASVSNKLFGSYGWTFFIFLGIISLFDTLLVSNVSESRYVHAFLSKLSPSFGKKDMSKNKTPHLSILILITLTIGIIFIFKNIEKTAIYGDLLILIILIIVNIIVIILRYKMPNTKRKFKIPFNIGKFPVTAGLAVLIGVYGIYRYIKK